jgi:hypothetical protein
MTLLNNLMKKYRINVVCENCNEFSEVDVPKGVLVKDFLSSNASKCPFCGCTALKRHISTKLTSGENSKK